MNTNGFPSAHNIFVDGEFKPNAMLPLTAKTTIDFTGYEKAINENFKRKGIDFDKSLQKNGQPTERNTFMPDEWKHTAAKVADPFLFTGLATFGSWEIFGNAVLPFVGKKIKEKGLKADSAAGQAIVGTALASQITTIFPIVGIAQNVYNDVVKKLGVPQTVQASSEVAKQIKEEMAKKINILKKSENLNEIELATIENFEKKLQSETFWSKLKEQITNGGDVNQKGRNMFFQFLEDGTAASFEVATKFFGGQGEIMNHIGSAGAAFPETIKDAYNVGVANRKGSDYIGKHKQENNEFLKSFGSAVLNGSNYKDPLEFHAKRAMLVPFRGAMRGLHHYIAGGIMEKLNLQRIGDNFNLKNGITEILYQASRNGLFQQLPWQMGKLGVDNLVSYISEKCKPDEKEYYISNLEEKVSHAKDNSPQGARLLEEGVNGKYITQDSVINSIGDFSESVAKIENYFEENIKNNKDFILEQIEQYEEHWAGEGVLLQDERKAIKEDLENRLENFALATKNAQEHLAYLKLLATKSQNPDEIRNYIECAKEIDKQITRRFEMFFPSGVIQQSFYENIKYKHFEDSLAKHNRPKIYNAPKQETSFIENETQPRKSYFMSNFKQTQSLPNLPFGSNDSLNSYHTVKSNNSLSSSRYDNTNNPVQSRVSIV